MAVKTKEHRVVFYHLAFYGALWVSLFFCMAIPIAIGVLSFSLVRESPLNDALNFLFSGWLGGAVISLITTPIIAPKLKRARAKLYHRLSSKYYKTDASPFTRKAILWLINVIARTDCETTEAQAQVINELIKLSTDNQCLQNKPRIMLIEGSAGCGKTKAIELTLQTLCENGAHGDCFEKLRQHVFYFDFADRAISAEDVANVFSTKVFRDALLILDNIHFVPVGDANLYKIIRETYNYRVGSPHVLVIVTRSIEFDLSTVLQSDVKKFPCFQLNETPKFDTSSQQDQMTEAILKHISTNDAGKIVGEGRQCFEAHLARMWLLYMQEGNKEFPEIQEALLGSQLTDGIFQKSLIAVTSCFVFTGNCRADVVEATLSEAISLRHPRRLLRLLEKCGLLSSFANMKTARFAFHQLSARIILQQLTKGPKELDFAKAVFRIMAKRVSDNYLQWCYTIPNAPKAAEELLWPLMNKRICSYLAMKDSLDFVVELFSLRDLSTVFMQVRLADRTGSYREGRDAAMEAYQKSHQAEALLLLLLSDHEALFDPQLASGFDSLFHSKDPYCNFAINAWSDHIWMHKGRWDFDNFLERVSKIGEQLEIIEQDAYDKQEVMRRCLFDCYRLYYLEGSLDWNKYLAIGKKLAPLKAKLKESMEGYREFESKFVEAHIVHYDFLFKVGCLKQDLTHEEGSYADTILAKYKGPGTRKYSECIDFAQKKRLLRAAALYSYLSAYRGFQSRGDKTAMYVALRICELDPFMARNYWDFESRRIQAGYEPRIDEILLGEIDERTYENVISFYCSFETTEGLEENFLEYAAYACTYKLKFLAMAFHDPGLRNVELQDVLKCGDKALSYDKKFHRKRNNRYGEVRIDLLSILFQYAHDNIEEKEFVRKLRELKQICTECNYRREVRVIEGVWPKGQPPYRETFHNIFEYYPIVLQ